MNSYIWYPEVLNCFRKEDDLKTHEQIHIQDMHFNCEKCEKSFKSKSELKNHSDDHSQNVSYKCGECDIFLTKGV